MPASQGCCWDESVQSMCSAVSAVFYSPQCTMKLVHLTQSRAGLGTEVGMRLSTLLLGDWVQGAGLQVPYLVYGSPEGCCER